MSRAAGGAGRARGGRAARSGIKGQRRRLSVVSDNKLIEGIATLGTNDEEKGEDRMPGHIVRCYAGVSKKGYAPYNPRKRNQDALLMEEHKESGTLVLCVLDGHGEAGDLVSHYFTDRLASRIFRNPAWEREPGKAIAQETAKLERAVLADASVDTEFSGTTAVLTCVRDNQLTVANIGDSRIILGRQGADGKMTAVEVSIDHKPDREDEKRRILAAGGRVFAVEYDDGIDGPPRVWLGHMDIPGLAMARSLGDSVAHTAGVISEPEMHTVTLTPEDKIMVIASDGLWEFCTNQEVIDMVVGTGAKEPKKAVDLLVAEASSRWMKEESVIDDTTIVVAYLK